MQYRSLYLEYWGVYLRFRTSFEAVIQYVNSSDHINTIFKHVLTLVILKFSAFITIQNVRSCNYVAHGHGDEIKTCYRI